MASVRFSACFAGLCGSFILLMQGAAAQENAPAEPPAADEDSAAQLEWAGHVYAFDPVDADGTGAPGWRWLDAAVEDAQFLMFGEQHYVAGIARTAQTAFDRYSGETFHALALEASPFLGREINRRDAGAVLADYPYELAFGVDGMVALIEAAEARAPDPEHAVFGIDQPVTAIHSFAHLGGALENAQARRIARGLSLKAALQAGRYLRVNHFGDIAALRTAAGGSLSADDALLIDEIERSMRIYNAFFAARRGEIPAGTSDADREALMGEKLDAALAELEEAGQDMPRLIVLMGGAHIVKGVGPNGVETLGQHASDIARSNGLRAIHIGIRRYMPDRVASPPALFSQSDAMLVDTAGVLQGNAPEAIAQLPASLQEDLSSFDALIYLRDAPQEGTGIMNSREAGFRQSVYLSLGLGGVPAILALLSLPALAWSAFGAVSGRKGSAGAAGLWGLMSAMAVGLTVITVLQVLAIRTPGNPAAMAGAGGMHVLAVTAVAVAAAGLLGAAWLRSWFGLASRIWFSVTAVAVVALALWMRHWNIGGMM